jgi:hypothetical protein
MLWWYDVGQWVPAPSSSLRLVSWHLRPEATGLKYFPMPSSFWNNQLSCLHTYNLWWSTRRYVMSGCIYTDAMTFWGGGGVLAVVVVEWPKWLKFRNGVVFV